MAATYQTGQLTIFMPQLEYLVVYGRASMGVPRAPTADCDWSAIGPPTQEARLKTNCRSHELGSYLSLNFSL